MRPTSFGCHVVLLVFAATAPLLAQQSSDSTITVTPGFEAVQFVAARAPIELALSRWPDAAEGRIAVMVGSTDFTPLFARAGSTLVFQSEAIALPAGESEVKTFLVSGSTWTELGRAPLHVLTPRGFETADIHPGAELNNTGQLAEGHSGSAPTPDRATFQDAGGTLSLATKHVRGGWTVQSQAHMLGTSRREQALRYGEKGAQASLLDLADFLVVATHAGTTLSAGHVTAGSNRHLINGFGSRGFTASFAERGATLSLAALNGSSIVGWDNIAGISHPTHRILSSSLGLELKPAQPGMLHVDATLVGGSLLPQGGYSQGGVLSAERSNGFGLQLSAATPAQRIRFAGGLASSKFESPPDPSLSGNLMPAPPAAQRHTARYAEVTVALVRDGTLWGRIPVNVNGAFRDERVDPLYRSVASPIQADVLRDALELTGNVDAVSVQLTGSRSADNLNDVPSILKMLSRGTGAVVNTPLAALLRISNRAAWLPSLSYGVQQYHQYGTGLAANASFAPSDVPDQLSVVQDASAQWQVNKWQLGYRYNKSTQDNRQPGRALADFAARTHGLTVAVTPRTNLDLGVEFNLERHDDLEYVQVSRLRRLSMTGNWRAGALLTLDLLASVSSNDDPAAGHDTHLSELRAGIARQFNLWHRKADAPTGQAYLRFARQTDRLLQYGPPLLGPPSQSGAFWNLTSGLTLRVF